MLGRGMRAALGALLLVGGLAGQDVRPGAAAGACTLVPALRDTTINQGLGSYGLLARGKETLVRVYLSKPNCAGTGDRIEVTSATLLVNVENLPKPSIDSTPVADTPLPLLPDAVVAPLKNGSGDPLFVLPGHYLTSTSPSTFGVTVTPRIGYRATTASGTVTEGTSTLGSTSALVGKPSKDLGVLVVPMGATQLGQQAQFPALATAALQNGMAAFGRMLPVRDGVGELGAQSTAGLRYTVAPTLLDVGPTGLNAMLPTPEGYKFCGNGTNFQGIANKLAEFRQAWNAKNPSAPADIVLGAVWQDISYGVADNQGCDEGRAWFVGREGWVRVTSDNALGAAMTGPVVAMEVMHDFGAVSPSDARHGGGYHSLSGQADVTAPDRAYNVTLRSFLPDDRSAMRLELADWTNRNVLLEKQEWELAQCKLTPGANCSGAGTFGTASAGSQSFTLAGTIRQAAGAEVADVHSAWVQGPVQHLPADPASPYTLVQLTAGGTTVRTDRIPFQEEQSDHHDGTDPHGQGRVIDVAVPAADAATAFELRSGTATLYRRQRGSAPDIVSPIAPAPGLASVRTGTALDDRNPALSGNGEVLAWEVGGDVQVARADGVGTTVTIVDAGQPAIADTGDGAYRLAFVRGTDVFTVELLADYAGVATTTPVEVPVYLAADQVFGDAASRPAWSPDGSFLAVEIAGGTWVIDMRLPGTRVTCAVLPLPGALCTELADNAAAPAWSAPVPGHPQGRIAAERLGTLILLDPAVPGGAPQATGIVGSKPAFGGPLLVFDGGNGIFAVDGRDEAPADPLRLTSDPDDEPSLRADGRLLAVDRRIGSSDEIVLVELGEVGTISFAATGDDATLLRADVFLDCGVSVPAILTGLRPVVRNGVAYFNEPYDSSPACRPSDILARVTDGYLTTTEKIGEIDDLQPPPEGPPVPAIAAPYDGSELFQYDAIPMSGSGRDAEDDDNVTLSWSLTGPKGSGIVDEPLGTGAHLPDRPPPRPQGWMPGEYEVKLTATDTDRRSASTSVRVHILEDKDGDRIPVDRELPCLGGGGDLDPSNAYGDPDGDALASIQDPAPCTSAENATADFEPNTLYVPSAGNTVTVHVTGPTVRGVDPTTVRLARAAGLTVDLPALSWSVDSSGRGTAKFDKQKLNSLLGRAQLVGLYVPMTVTARGSAGELVTRDHSAPVVSPGG